ncbi:hypothetical protein WUBG_15129, partial [Wuchereria bancrofti]
RAEASRQKCQLLNPNVELHVDTGDISEKDEKFIAGGVFGWIGYAFFDFTGCSFLVTVPKVRTGDILEDDSVGDHSSPAKKRRIGSEVENGKGGEENKTSVNVVLDDDEKMHMVTF